MRMHCNRLWCKQNKLLCKSNAPKKMARKKLKPTITCFIEQLLPKSLYVVAAETFNCSNSNLINVQTIMQVKDAVLKKCSCFFMRADFCNNRLHVML